MRLAPRGVRMRLTLWYAGTLALVLTAYSAGLYGFLKHNLLIEIDRSLRSDVEIAEEAIQDLPKPADGRPDFSNLRGIGGESTRDRWLLEIRSGAGGGYWSFPPHDRSPLGDLRCQGKRADAVSLALPDGLKLRAKCTKAESHGLPLEIWSARSAERVEAELAELLWIMLLSVPAAIAVSAFGGYLLARRALLPVQRMTAKAAEMSAERLGERLPVENPGDELGHLALTFNQTFDRLENSFEQMRRFTADASHELRTPLTAMRTLGEVSLREDRPGETYRDTISSMLEETDRLRHLVDSLLTLSRADAGQLRLSRARIELQPLIERVVEHLEVLAEDKGQTIKVELTPGLAVQADETALRQALINLVDNAIKYSPNGKRIHIRARARGDRAEIEVSDEGIGISSEDLPRIFDRFFRVDPSRTRDQGGTGLGLSISRWAVEASGGSIVASSELGKGASFKISLPCAD
jgi:heavy metal sensor kinase